MIICGFPGTGKSTMAKLSQYETYTAELPELKHKIRNIKSALHNLERMIRE